MGTTARGRVVGVFFMRSVFSSYLLYAARVRAAVSSLIAYVHFRSSVQPSNELRAILRAELFVELPCVAATARAP